MADQLAVFIDFENVALWAEREFFDFEITPLMEYLQTRGPAVVKRAYGDWSRFSRYRESLMNNSIDLIQIYSVRQGKNRADIRMAIDAFEVALTRTQISTFVIVSGDSDFGPLVSKLREYGKYTIGVGPRNISPDLLVKSCDEFVFLETALGDINNLDEQASLEREEARSLLLKAIQAHEQRGDLPVLATRLKQTMLLMDPTFNEANFGFVQFKTWLENNPDLIRLFVKESQLFAVPFDFLPPKELDFTPIETAPLNLEAPGTGRLSLETQYRQVFNRSKLLASDLATRRDVLRDIYREVSASPSMYTTDSLLDELRERYEVMGTIRSKSTLRDILQMAYRQQAFEYENNRVSLHSLVRLAPEIDSEAIFVGRAESDFIFTTVRAGLEIDLPELAAIILNNRDQVEYIQYLLDDLVQRAVIVYKARKYNLPGRGAIPFASDPALKILVSDIEGVEIPADIQPGSAMAHNLSKKAMVQRSQDFAASGASYLLACRVQWDAVQASEQGATLEDLRWFLASYASAMAGKLSQVNRDYASARPYYLAFFALVQEDDPLWGRMRGLINPMLSYYWANAARELELNVTAWNQFMSSPAQIAIYAATHPDPDLRRLWQKITQELAQVNPQLLRRITNQIALTRAEEPENIQVARQIESILSSQVVG